MCQLSADSSWHVKIREEEERGDDRLKLWKGRIMHCSRRDHNLIGDWPAQGLSQILPPPPQSNQGPPSWKD